MSVPKATSAKIQICTGKHYLAKEKKTAVNPPHFPFSFDKQLKNIARFQHLDTHVPHDKKRLSENEM